MKHIEIILNVFSLLLILYALIIALQASLNLKGSFAVHRLFNSWRQKPIIDLKTSRSESCAEIGMENLLAYLWPGTAEGCDCTSKYSRFLDSSGYSGNVYRGYCSTNMTMAGCSNIKPMEAQFLRKWRGTYLCGTYGTSDYFGNQRSKNGDCESGYKKCGKLDTLGNHLCIEEKLNCPPSEVIVDPNSKRFELKYTNHTDTGFILTELKITDGEICINSDNERQFYESDYLLIQSSGKSGCYSKVGDYGEVYHDKSGRYKVLDEYTKSEFYKDNDLLKPIRDYLPAYPHIDHVDVNLYTGIYIGWKASCKVFGHSNLSSLDDRIISHFNSIESNTYTICLTFFLLLVFLIFSVIFISKEGYVDDKPYMMTILYGVVFVIFLFIRSIAAHNYNLTNIANNDNPNNMIHDFIDLVGNKDCSDSVTNTLLRGLSIGYILNNSIFSQLVIISYFIILISFILAVLPYIPIFAVGQNNTILASNIYKEIDKDDHLYKDGGKYTVGQDAIPTLDELEALNKK
jgi:hypothetical protein